MQIAAVTCSLERAGGDPHADAQDPVGRYGTPIRFPTDRARLLETVDGYPTNGRVVEWHGSFPSAAGVQARRLFIAPSGTGSAAIPSGFAMAHRPRAKPQVLRATTEPICPGGSAAVVGPCAAVGRNGIGKRRSTRRPRRQEGTGPSCSWLRLPIPGGSLRMPWAPIVLWTWCACLSWPGMSEHQSSRAFERSSHAHAAPRRLTQLRALREQAMHM